MVLRMLDLVGFADNVGVDRMDVVDSSLLLFRVHCNKLVFPRVPTTHVFDRIRAYDVLDNFARSSKWQMQVSLMFDMNLLAWEEG